MLVPVQHLHTKWFLLNNLMVCIEVVFNVSSDQRFYEVHVMQMMQMKGHCMSSSFDSVPFRGKHGYRHPFVSSSAGISYDFLIHIHLHVKMDVAS